MGQFDFLLSGGVEGEGKVKRGRYLPPRPTQEWPRPLSRRRILLCQRCESLGWSAF